MEQKCSHIFIGSRIRERRKHLHLTQKQLAKMLNLTQSSICEYETEKSVPALENLIGLATALHTSVDYLLGLTDNPHPSYFSDAMTETERDLFQIFYSLPSKKRERVVGILIGLRDG